jgi:hypothetical protein
MLGKKLSEEHGQFERGFQVASDGHPLLEKGLLGRLPAANNGLKRHGVRVISYGRPLF